MHLTALNLPILFVCLLPMPDDAKKSDQPDESVVSTSGVKTMGGRQFWGDVVFFRGYRIQRNVLTGHHRLLDDKDNRHESGTLEVCQERLNQIRTNQKLAPMSGRAVVLIHGIGRSSKSFAGMQSKLMEDGYTVVGFDYPSTRISIEDSTNFLKQLLESLKGIDSIDVVCHSMGGLLLRAFLKEHHEPRLRRAVMLGVPNKGARMADVLKNNPLFRVVLGPAGQQLVTDKSGLIGSLPTPDFEFGVLAGGRSAARGFNPLLPGDNDSTVTVSSTRLPGAADFILLPVIHSFLMTDATCIEATTHFLAHGRFKADKPAAPISPGDIYVVE